MAGSPNAIDAPRQPTAAMSGAPMTATTTVPTLPPAMWALIANPRRSVGNCSARRPLPTGCCGDATDPRGDVRDREGDEARRERLQREPAPEQDPAEAEQLAPRRDAGQAGIAQLDDPGQERADRGEEGDRFDADAELVDDAEEDQRQDDGLGVRPWTPVTAITGVPAGPSKHVTVSLGFRSEPGQPAVRSRPPRQLRNPGGQPVLVQLNPFPIDVV